MSATKAISPVSFDIYRPAFVALADNLIAAVFPLMKIYPAEYCLRTAIKQGLIDDGTVIVETSSGNLALGLAIVCNSMGQKLTIVTDYACDPHLCRRLTDLGTNLEIVPAPAATGGYQRARLDRLEEIRQVQRNHWWLNQYDNLGNSEAYRSFAQQILETVGPIDCLVGTVGSGGSVCGTAKALRETLPMLHVIGVDTFGSVLFGQPERPRVLRGLGNSIMPKNLDHTVFDEVHWVTAAEAYKASRVLHQRTALFRGGTSGASWLVAQHWARMNPEARVLCIFPDDGYRYADTIYNDSYLAASGLILPSLPSCPKQVDQPSDSGPEWSWMKWMRRSLVTVMQMNHEQASRLR
ncbi:MAG TPA: cysteine synthase family protein [Candidatus Angelobacter sp.]